MLCLEESSCHPPEATIIAWILTSLKVGQPDVAYSWRNAIRHTQHLLRSISTKRWNLNLIKSLELPFLKSEARSQAASQGNRQIWTVRHYGTLSLLLQVGCGGRIKRENVWFTLINRDLWHMTANVMCETYSDPHSKDSHVIWFHSLHFVDAETTAQKSKVFHWTVEIKGKAGSFFNHLLLYNAPVDIFEIIREIYGLVGVT